MSDYGYIATTFFCVIHSKSLENMGIEPCWERAEELQANFESAVKDIVKDYVYTICISAEGVYHIHLVCTFDSAKRSKSVAKMLGNCHVEEMRGTKEQADNYINKRGKFEEKGEKILLKGGSIDKIRDNSGRRTDYQNFDNMVYSGQINPNTLDGFLLQLSNEVEVRNFTARYNRILRMRQPNYRTVTVIYVEGKSGSGKSRGAIERYPDAFRASVANKTNFPFNGYMGEKVLWLDELRPGVFSHAELMQILDGYRMSVDVKYGQMPAMWDTVIITSAFPFDEWYKDGVKWEIGREEFVRRITKRYTAIEGEWVEKKEGTSPRQDFMPIDKNEIPFT